jgi:Replication-relaxation
VPKRKGWYERQEVNRLSHDWVKMNCKNITKREKELLKIVHERKLVRRDHLEIIHPSYRKAGKNKTSILNRSIKKLFEKMCLDKVHEEPEFMTGNNPAIIAIDRAGAMILDVPFKRRIKQAHRFIGTDKYVFRELPSNYPHIHGVNKIETITIQLAEKMNFTIVRWDLEHKNAKLVQFNEKFTIIPDIFTIFRLNFKQNKPFLAFIEYDTGSEDNRYKDKFPTLRDKMEKYQKYKLSGAWKNEWWSKKIKTGFPLLLFVTEDEKRVDYLNKKGKEIGLRVLAMHIEDYEKNMATLLSG